LKTGLEEQLDPVPRLDRIISIADARVRGMSEALAGRADLLRTVCEDSRSAEAARNCLAAIEMKVRRFHAAGFSSYEGRLENPRHIEELAERFSREREFSATQLEAYAVCPFRFLMSHVLKIEPLSAPDVDTDLASRGILVHAI